MTSNGTSTGSPADAPAVVRRLESEAAQTLVDLVETFDDLQMVLRCCERLVTEIADRDTGSDVVVEGVWTLALSSYGRCFAAHRDGAVLTEGDVTAAQPGDAALEWHQVLLRLRDHHTDPVANPRERFTVGVAQDPGGAASGIAITSARQPQVDDLTVRQAGATAYALSGLVNERIEAQQVEVFRAVKDATPADLEKLDRLDLAQPSD
jgi:hypothetical protein